MIGLTSVTFRSLKAEEIVELARRAGLAGIEWGGDVHVKPGDEAEALRVGSLTRNAGLQVSSYGSYFRLCAQEEPETAFAPVLASARALGAPLIRVWAGERDSAGADEAYYRRAAEDLRRICGMAGEIRVALEYHRHTLTDCCDSAARLLDMAGCGASYWQPNPDISHGENLAELQRMLPYLTNVHVFHWEGADVRYPLERGAADWRAYIALAGSERDYIMEFVQDDDPERFIQDARTLREWMGA